MTALYTFSVIVSCMPLFSQTLSQSHLKVDLTLALRELTSLLMMAGRESMLCRYMNLSITLRVSFDGWYYKHLLQNWLV